MADPDLGLSYRFEPAAPGAGSPAPVLLVLHEGDQLPACDVNALAVAQLWPAGTVEEDGLARYFPRRDDESFDADDLHRCANGLAGFVARACEALDLDPSRVWVLGISNAAAAAAALALDHPDAVAGGVLLSGVAPFEAEGKPLVDKLFFCGQGRKDEKVSMDQHEELVELLVAAGAEVELHWYHAGHEITQDELGDVTNWLAKRLAAPQDPPPD